MVDIEQIWLELSRNLPVLSGTIAMTETDDDFCKAWEEVNKLGLEVILCEILRSELQSAIRDKIVPAFWSHFPVRVEMNEYDVDSQFHLFHQFAAAVENLQKSFICLELVSRRVINLYPQTNLKTWDFKTVLLQTLLAQIPTGFNEAVFAFYQVSFQIYIQQHNKQKTGPSEADIVLTKQECCGCKNKVSLCECQTLDETIDKTNKALQEIELLDGIAGQSLTSLVQKCIEEHIKDTCHGIFDRSFLRQLEMNSLVFDYGIYGPRAYGNVNVV
ncbi:PREDICTED: anaphase-promoting complex subunit 2-like isoform X1 [Rhagoletis zephyria]|uniref:anaphase-promoting complex subunit 2-like isoform X1 n=1 Tax=Rhagoletis zephyria TaxID=28612 RepID=UPI0008113CFD|nr:PREDICTED: anaphase-promoting complex subunit 2-like isoform X1 [Rhagoletis zephyria]